MRLRSRKCKDNLPVDICKKVYTTFFRNEESFCVDTIRAAFLAYSSSLNGYDKKPFICMFANFIGWYLHPSSYWNNKIDPSKMIVYLFGTSYKKYKKYKNENENPQSSLYLLFKDIIHHPAFYILQPEVQFCEKQQIQCIFSFFKLNGCLEYLIKDVWNIVFEYLIFDSEKIHANEYDDSLNMESIYM